MVEFHDDKDIVRAVGQVAIEFAGLEEIVDVLLDEVEKRELLTIPDALRKPFCSFMDKICFLRKRFLPLFDEHPERLNNEDERADAVLTFDDCEWCAHERNNILHSPIVADMRHNQIIQKSRRRGLNEVTPAQIYDVAQKIWATGSGVRRLRFHANRLRLARTTIEARPTRNQ